MRLTLDLDDGSGSSRPIAIDADDHATIGDVAAEIARGLRQRELRRPNLKVVGRPAQALHPDALLATADLRTGDRVELAAGGSGSVEAEKGAATVVVEAGPESGRRIELGPGRHYVGRGGRSTVVIEDDQLSRVHFSIRVGDDVEVADEGSTNGTKVDGAVLAEPLVLKPGQRVMIGTTVLRVDLHEGGLATAAKGAVLFNRPPRVWKPFAGSVVKLPSGVGPAPRLRIPKVSALAPLIMGLALYALTRRVETLMFMLMSPIIMIGSSLESRRGAHRDHADSVQRTYEDLHAVDIRLGSLVEEERTSREHEAPAVGELSLTVDQLGSRLWERSSDDDDFLRLRLGVGELPLRTSLEWTPIDRGIPDLHQAIDTVREKYSRLRSAPVVVSLRTVGSLGMAGSQVETESMARSLLCQIGVLHSPADVVIATLLGCGMQKRWEWLMWLPHVRSAASPLSANHLPPTEDGVHQLLDSIAQLVEKRRTDKSNSPTIVVLIDESVPIERNRLNWLFQLSPELGVHVIWLGSSIARMPKGCGAIAESPKGQAGMVGWTESGDSVREVRFEGIPEEHAARIARRLAPVMDVSAGAAGGSALPAKVALPDVLDRRDAFGSPEVMRQVWKQSAGRPLTAKLGVSGSGAFAIDLRLDGPHALIAGTTGAGKSELLQTIIASLAATHSPDRVTFLLVDYKGGSAFSTCVELPHTIGLVTDLDTNQVRRALVSLQAELHHRERLLERVRCKDLIEMEHQFPDEAPPSLILVVDEFAALAKEIPEFVEGVVNIAQRGRSLGIHLILATQRPAGVITDNIRANTNLRIALRVSDSSESSDVLNSPIAATISRTTPGRAVAKVGPQELVSFQAAYMGGHSNMEQRKAVVSVSDIGYGTLAPWPQATDATSAQPNTATDLRRLVDTAKAAFALTGRPAPRKAWLPPLQSTVDLFSLPRPQSDDLITLGVSDDPQSQQQQVATWSSEFGGSIAIFGGGGSGKSTLLRTIAASVSSVTEDPPPHIYALDFAGRSLEPLEELPTVGSVIGADEHERVTRLLTMLKLTIELRSVLFADARASDLSSFRRLQPDVGKTIPRIYLLIDGYPNFINTYERIERGVWSDLVPKLMVDGRAVGVHMVLTADRRTSLGHSTFGLIPQRVVLRLANDDEYYNLNVKASMIGTHSPEGRAIWNDRETQIAVTGGSVRADEQSIAISKLGAQLRRQRPGVRTPEIGVLPTEVDRQKLVERFPGAFAMASSSLKAIPIALSEPGFLVSGPMKSGKSLALVCIAEALRDISPNRPILLISPRSDPIQHHPVWSHVAAGENDALALLKQFTDELSHIPQAEPPVVMLDDFHHLHETDVGQVVSALLKGAKEHPVAIVASSDSAVARRASQYNPIGELRQYKRGLLLAPDNGAGDGDTLNVTLPNTSIKVWPAGRGYFVVGGAMELVQVGVPGH
jgi:DNA segregation ATPase FtsK/SpoIIIE, S-DNA-T family